LALKASKRSPKAWRYDNDSLLSPLSLFSMTSKSIFHFFLQVNTSLTNLNLNENWMGPEAGIAIAKSLEV
jgi:hypothetical protein